MKIIRGRMGWGTTMLSTAATVLLVIPPQALANCPKGQTCQSQARPAAPARRAPAPRPPTGGRPAPQPGQGVPGYHPPGGGGPISRPGVTPPGSIHPIRFPSPRNDEHRPSPSGSHPGSDVHIGGGGPRPAYHYPRGYHYHRYGIHGRLPPVFILRQYYIVDYDLFGVDPPPYGFQWIQYGPDLLLVNVVTGDIVQVMYGVFDDDGGDPPPPDSGF